MLAQLRLLDPTVSPDDYKQPSSSQPSEIDGCLESEGEWDLQELRDDIEYSIDFAVNAESRLISFKRSGGSGKNVARQGSQPVSQLAPQGSQPPPQASPPSQAPPSLYSRSRVPQSTGSDT